MCATPEVFWGLRGGGHSTESNSLRWRIQCWL